MDADRDAPVPDDELTRQALAADVDAPIADDAEPFVPGDRGAALLPEWYMPATLRASSISGPAGRRRRWAIGAVVGALIVVNGLGLCVAYGFPEIAW